MSNLSLIVAIANNNAIGFKNQLLVNLPKDLKWFKDNTINNTIIMGRKTYESLPIKPLPNRKNIVLTKNYDFFTDKVIVVRTLEELWKETKQYTNNFVIGGEQIYKLLLPFVNKLYITRIHKTFEKVDVFFPDVDFSNWNLVFKKQNFADEKHICNFDFLIYEKIIER